LSVNKQEKYFHFFVWNSLSKQKLIDPGNWAI
jgi:hypothetical protein